MSIYNYGNADENFNHHYSVNKDKRNVDEDDQIDHENGHAD